MQPGRRTFAVLFVAGSIGFLYWAGKTATEEQRRQDSAAQAAGFANDAELKAATAKGFNRAEPYRLQILTEAETARAEKAKRDASAAKAKAEADADKALRERYFQEAAVYGTALKKSMKNPDSFKLEEVRRTGEGFYCFEYRATNSFNAMIPGKALFGKGTAASSDESGKFAGLWNKHCTKPAESLSNVVYAFKNGYF